MQDPRLLVARERLEALEAFPRGPLLLGRHGLPVTIVLDHARPLLGREAAPPLEVSFGDRTLLGRELLEPLHPRGLAPRNLEDPGQQEHQQYEKSRQPAGPHGHLTSLGGASVCVCESRTGSVSSIRSRSMSRIRVRKLRSRVRSASFRRSRSSSICAYGLGIPGCCVSAGPRGVAITEATINS